MRTLTYCNSLIHPRSTFDVWIASTTFVISIGLGSISNWQVKFSDFDVFRFRVAQFCSILHCIQIQSLRGLDPAKAGRRREGSQLESISPLTRELRMQNKTHSKSKFGLSAQEWGVRVEWGREEWGFEKGSGLGRTQPWTSFLRLGQIWTNLVSEPRKPQSGPTQGIWPPVCPFSCHFVPFLAPGTNCCRSEILLIKNFRSEMQL